jgi:hypothetical protein
MPHGLSTLLKTLRPSDDMVSFIVSDVARANPGGPIATL